jgi:hypothetical protein
MSHLDGEVSEELLPAEADCAAKAMGSVAKQASASTRWHDLNLNKDMRFFLRK